MSAASEALPSATAQFALEVQDLEVYFPIYHGVLFRRHVGDVRAVDGVSLRLRRGETLGLVGESGSGKSTIAKTVVGLERPTAGRVLFEGRDVSQFSRSEARSFQRRVQLIFQNPYGSLNPRMTIGNIISDPMRVHRIGSRQERRDRTAELLKLVGLDASIANRYPNQFSGGQRQRIGVARALVLSPAVIVCDEPVSALDVSIQAQILNLLHDLQVRFSPAYLVISHDLAVVRHVSDYVAVMYLGRLVESGPRDTLYENPLHPYTKALLAAVHVPDPAFERSKGDTALRGEIPSPANPPTGCRFHPRCPLWEALGKPKECVVEEPAHREISGRQVACHFADQP